VPRAVVRPTLGIAERRAGLPRVRRPNPRPVLQANETARILVVGQAAGVRAHITGIPWNDRSGERLRAWMGIDRDLFYDESHISRSFPWHSAIPDVGMATIGRLVVNVRCYGLSNCWDGCLESS
jgi:uracil-DNA glycosylase